ncbi:MAG TPA: trigger factor [Treponema sp.]|nr:trigger factor [Treponema sp.]
MAATKEITALEKSSVKLTLTVPKDDVRSQYQELLKEYRKNVQLPGFRKGMVPQEVLERKYGEALKGEALGRIIETAVSEVFEDENLSRQEKPLPYSRPEMKDEPKLDFDQDLVFSLVYDVLPVVNVGAWKGIEVEVPEVSVSDEDIGRELEEIRERNAIVLDKADDALSGKDDVVTVDYCEIGEDGEIVPDSQRQGFAFTLGTGYNLFKFDDEITGMKKGETREFEKTYPADFPDSDLAGKTKKLRVTLTALKSKNFPDLDDEFAQDVDEKFKTLDDLKNSIRERLDKRLQQKLKDIKVTRILEKIMETTPVDLPESMIRIEIEGRWRNLAQRFNATAEQVRQMMAGSGQNIEEIEKEWRPAAEKALHSRLIVETLMEQEKMEVSEEDAEKELEVMAAEAGADVAEYKKYYKDDNMWEYLKEDIKERRLFDMLIAENNIKTGKKENFLDIMTKNG